MLYFFTHIINPNSSLPMFVQIFGLIIMAMSSTIYLNKKHKTMLYVKITTDSCWLIYHIFAFIFTGGNISVAAITVVAIIRSFIFISRDNHKWASGRYWLYVFISLSIITTGISWIITWKTKGTFDPFAFLTLAASIISIISFYQPSATVSRWLSFVIGGFMISYHIINYILHDGAGAASILNEILNFIITTVGVIKYNLRKTDKQEQN